MNAEVLDFSMDNENKHDNNNKMGKQNSDIKNQKKSDNDNPKIPNIKKNTSSPPTISRNNTIQKNKDSTIKFAETPKVEGITVSDITSIKYDPDWHCRVTMLETDNINIKKIELTGLQITQKNFLINLYQSLVKECTMGAYKISATIKERDVEIKYKNTKEPKSQGIIFKINTREKR